MSSLELLEPSSLSSLVVTLSQICHREIRDRSKFNESLDNQGEMRRDETWTVTGSDEVRTRDVSATFISTSYDGNTPVALSARC